MAEEAPPPFDRPDAFFNTMEGWAVFLVTGKPCSRPTFGLPVKVLDTREQSAEGMVTVRVRATSAAGCSTMVQEGIIIGDRKHSYAAHNYIIPRFCQPLPLAWS